MEHQQSDPERVRDVIVVGAGPAGLAAAIAARRARLDCEVFERAALVNSILKFPTNMVFFTTPELLEIGELPFVTPYAKPTRDEALRYYRRTVDAFDLTVRLGYEVASIDRQPGPDAAAALAVDVHHPHEGSLRRLARTVVVAVGAYDCPNRLGIPGEDLPHVSHYYTEAHPWYRKRVVVVGGKNSAAEAALELYRSGVHVTLVHRHAELGDGIKYWVRPDIENRIKEGSIPARFETRVVEIRPREVVVESAAGREVLPAEPSPCCDRYHPTGTAMLPPLRIDVDDATMVPAHAETYETNVPNLFLAGRSSRRYSGQIFIENGRFHGQRSIGEIARRLAPAGDAVPA